MAFLGLGVLKHQPHSLTIPVTASLFALWPEALGFQCYHRAREEEVGIAQITIFSPVFLFAFAEEMVSEDPFCIVFSDIPADSPSFFSIVCQKSHNDLAPKIMLIHLSVTTQWHPLSILWKELAVICQRIESQSFNVIDVFNNSTSYCPLGWYPVIYVPRSNLPSQDLGCREVCLAF